jgi:hypothetical protein
VVEVKKDGRVEREMAESVVEGRTAEELSLRRSKHAIKVDGCVDTFILRVEGFLVPLARRLQRSSSSSRK